MTNFISEYITNSSTIPSWGATWEKPTSRQSFRHVRTTNTRPHFSCASRDLKIITDISPKGRIPVKLLKQQYLWLV